MNNQKNYDIASSSSETSSTIHHEDVVLSSSSDLTTSSLSNRNVRRIQKGAMAGDGTKYQEAAIGFASGIIYGFISPLIGHPFDSIKTRMQADPIYQHLSFRKTVLQIYKTDGIIKGYYRGFIPPLIGSMMFRGLQFSVYAGSYSAYEEYLGSGPIPYTGGLRPSVLFGSITAAFVRSIIESPLDYIKVRNMVGKSTFQQYQTPHNSTTAVIHQQSQYNYMIKEFVTSPVYYVRQLYHGFVPTLLRTFGLFLGFFVMVDYSIRYIPDVINAPYYGPFFKGGICATAAWVFAFPFETAKSIIQADTTQQYKNKPFATYHVLRQVYHERGIIHGIYRGFGPGASRSFIANGTSMIVFAKVQELIRENM